MPTSNNTFNARRDKKPTAKDLSGTGTQLEKSLATSADTPAIQKLASLDQAKSRLQGPVDEQKQQDVRAQSMLHADKLSNALYFPVDSSDEQLVWEHVVKTFKSMSQHDFSQDSQNFDAYSMQYYMNSYLLARTRLCRIQQDDEDEGQLHLELNKLEGHSFQFYDQYSERLKQCVKQIGKEPEGVEVQEEQNPDPFDFLDLSETSSVTIVDGWLEDLKVDDDLVYDANRVFAALSSLAWNCKSEENKQKLMEHAPTIIPRTIAILRELNKNQAVTYFGSACLSEFTGEKFETCTWEDIGVLCDVLKEWCKTQEEVTNDAEVKKINSILVRDIPQSREIVRAVFTTLLKLKGVDLAVKSKNPSRKLRQKMKLFKESPDSAEKFQFADIDPDTVATVQELLKVSTVLKGLRD